MSTGGSHGGGRKKDPIRSFFEECLKDDNKTEMRCKKCKTVVSAKSCRMKNHYNKCSKRVSLDTIGSDEDQIQENMNDRSRSPIPIATTSSTIISNTSRTSVKVQSSINAFTVKTSKLDKEKLDKAVARYFYACNVPFSHANRFHFKKMIEEIRPGYSPPSRKELATGLLDTLSDEAFLEARSKLLNKTVTLIQDGWSTVHNDPVIANCVSDGNKAYFLSAIDTETNHKSTEYCLKLAEDAISECEAKFGCFVKSFVSDNENKMKKLRKELMKNHCKDGTFFISYGCAAHFLNLLGSDICKTKNISTILSHVVDISKYFRNHHIAKGHLNAMKGSLIPQLPAETRWNSNIHCLEVFLRNKEFYIKILDDHEEDIDNNICNLIHNIGLFKEVKHLVNQLKPISIALDRLQGDAVSIADATKEWISLLNLQEELLQPYQELIKKRFEDSITPAHLLAYMLHPKHMGDGLTAEQEEKARVWVEKEIDPNFLPFITQFSIKSHPFPQTFFTEAMSNLAPNEWWEAQKRNKNISMEFVAFAVHLFHCVASSACIERIFSNFSLIQNKLRNRLGLQTAAKLVMTYKMLNTNLEAKNVDEEY